MHLAHGNIFDDPDLDAIVVPVNCMGVMGKGLALEAKRRYPAVNAFYRRMVQAGTIRPGASYNWCGSADSPCLELATTKRDWRDPSRLDWVDSICKALAITYRDRGLMLGVPALGCGEGKLSFDDVLPVMQYRFRGMSNVRVFEPR